MLLVNDSINVLSLYIIRLLYHLINRNHQMFHIKLNLKLEVVNNGNYLKDIHNLKIYIKN